MTTPRFARVYTRKPDGFYVQFERLLIDNDTTGRPDEHDEGFLPSQDPNAAGWVAPENFESEMQKARAHMQAFESGIWSFIGVRARANCMVVRNGTGTLFNLESAGLWGVESDSSEEDLNQIFEEEKADLLSMIGAMQSPIFA